MEVPFFLAADFANKGDSGKVNVLGIFNVIYAKTFPIRHRTLYLVIRVSAEYGEYDVDHEMRIIFLDEDGNELGAREGVLSIKRPPSGRTALADLIMEVADLVIEKPGRYEFRLVINRDVKGIIALDVVQLQSENAEQ